MYSNLKHWLRASLQGTSFLGLVLIASVWGALTLHLDFTRRAAIEDATQNVTNLVRSFEEHVSRAILGQDATLLILRGLYERDPAHFSFVDWPGRAGPVSDLVLQYAIIDRNGRLVTSSAGASQEAESSEHDYFRAHLNEASDRLFIGRSVKAPLSGKTIIQLSRKLVRPDGSFDGVIVAVLNPQWLTSYYDLIEVGRNAALSIVGDDGYLRAERGFHRASFERMPPGKGVMKKLDESPSGVYINDRKFDGVERLVAYRKSGKLPLAAVLGIATQEVLAQYYADRAKYIAAATGITLIVLIVILQGIRHRRRLDLALDGLRRSETMARDTSMGLQTTLDNIDQGILMSDAEGRIQVINRRTIELLDLPGEWLEAKPDLTGLLQHLIARGEFGEDGDLVSKEFCDPALQGDEHPAFAHFERTRPDGTILEVRSRRLPAGGMVRTLTDVTERRRAEARVAHMATHDELTGLANRALFRARVGEALARAQRFGESFSVMVFDLDRFKEINDSKGHPCGDAVLKEIGRRIAQCLRQTDTAARLGGDEFAVLQTRTRGEEDATRLAQRIIQAVRAPFAVNGEEIVLSISVGIAQAPRDGLDYDLIVRKADQAMYRAKNSGGNIFCFARGPFVPRMTGEDAGLVRAAS
jgi:diguanylate cyclase (GGDEF)-like protein